MRPAETDAARTEAGRNGGGKRTHGVRSERKTRVGGR
jgi:hypothetical protein